MTFCGCSSPSGSMVDGVLICEECGERIRDPREQARDAVIAGIARGVANLNRPVAQPLIAPVPRLALTRGEAARALGMGLTSFKSQVQPDLRMIRRGKLRLIPTAELERWLKENAEVAMADQVSD